MSLDPVQVGSVKERRALAPCLRPQSAGSCRRGAVNRGTSRPRGVRPPPRRPTSLVQGEGPRADGEHRACLRDHGYILRERPAASVPSRRSARGRRRRRPADVTPPTPALAHVNRLTLSPPLRSGNPRSGRVAHALRLAPSLPLLRDTSEQRPWPPRFPSRPLIDRAEPPAARPCAPPAPGSCSSASR